LPFVISATNLRDSYRTPRASQVAYPSSEGYVTYICNSMHSIKYSNMPTHGFQKLGFVDNLGILTVRVKQRLQYHR